MMGPGAMTEPLWAGQERSQEQSTQGNPHLCKSCDRPLVWLLNVIATSQSSLILESNNNNKRKLLGKISVIYLSITYCLSCMCGCIHVFLYLHLSNPYLYHLYLYVYIYLYMSVYSLSTSRSIPVDLASEGFLVSPCLYRVPSCCDTPSL